MPRENGVGRLVAGRYRLLALLGRGGVGTVYRARDEGADQEVALKVLRRDLLTDPLITARFRREARVISRIDHPSITAIVDFGATDDNSLYIALELVNGPSLAEVVDREGALPLSRALNILRQITEALIAAHAAGVVHRDLTATNVGLATEDQVKVFDFGLAKIIGPEGPRVLSAPTGYTLGTPEYMAPEQITGEPLDHRTDIYSFGVIAFEVLTGRLPFSGTEVDIFRSHVNTTPTPPSLAAGRELPGALDTLVLRCLAKYADQRYGDAAEVVARITALQQAL